MTSDRPRNKEYQRIRNWLSLVSIVISLLMLVLVIGTGLTRWFYDWAGGTASQRYVVLFLYFLAFSVYSMIFSFPLSFYSGFLLEHRFNLSNQRLGGWFVEWGKKQILSFAIMVPLILGLYALIWNAETNWWFFAWAAYALFSLILGQLFPVLIIPLFYKYSPIGDESLKDRICKLANRYGFAMKHVFSLNLSKTTKKANAMFTGLGKTKRVVLADTLINSFSHDEIEAVVAHELGHCKHRDIWKQFGFGVALSFIGFWIAYRIFGNLSDVFGYGGAGDVRALPLLLLIFFIFSLVLSPLSNAFSRWAERRADQFALEATNNVDAFISTMRKLGDQNLADPEPHPVIEFLLYDHPAIGKRIQSAQKFSRKRD